MGKSGLAVKPIIKARTRKRLAPSKISAPLVWAGRYIIPAYLRYVLKFKKIEIRNPAVLVQAIRDFQDKRTRLIVAFRHPYGDEAQLLFHVFENLIPRHAKQLNKPLAHSPGLRTIHDYAVALWGDAVIRFILPRVGALPVYHIKFDSESLQGIRSVMRDGPSPLGLAPEGQISYHAETLPRIEQGTIRMGFWCARDIEKAGRPERVLVMPLSVHYQYDSRDVKKIRAALDRIEALCGLHVKTEHQEDAAPASLLPRIDAIENHLLAVTEAYYTSNYGYQPSRETAPGESEAAVRHERWIALQPFALMVAERLLGIEPKQEDTVQRMYRIRLVGWDRVCPESPVEQLAPLEAALAHRRAGEAWYAMRHMELVDLMSYHDADYLDGTRPSGLSFDRLVETVVTLEDLTFRLMGGNITNRPNRIRKKAVLIAGSAIDLTAKLPDYHKNSKKTTLELTDELAGRFKECIEVYRNGSK